MQLPWIYAVCQEPPKRQITLLPPFSILLFSSRGNEAAHNIAVLARQYAHWCISTQKPDTRCQAPSNEPQAWMHSAVLIRGGHLLRGTRRRALHARYLKESIL